MTYRGRERRHRRRREGDADEPWTRGDQREFEEGLRAEMSGIRTELGLARRQLSMLVGGVAVVAFIAAPIVATIITLAAGAGR